MSQGLIDNQWLQGMAGGAKAHYDCPAGCRPTGHTLVAKQFGILNRHLNGRECILDGGRSVIDANAFPMIRWVKKMLPGGLEEYPKVQALHDWLDADPAVQSVLAREAGK